MKKRGLTGENAVNLFLFAVSAFYLTYTLLNYKIGTVRAPKEGFMPLITGIGMTALSAFLTARSLVQKSDGQNVKFGISWLRFALLIAASFAYALTMSYLGYAVGTFLFLAAVLFIVKAASPLKILVISAVSSAVFYAVFRIALGVMLPVGVLGI